MEAPEQESEYGKRTASPKRIGEGEMINSNLALVAVRFDDEEKSSSTDMDIFAAACANGITALSLESATDPDMAPQASAGPRADGKDLEQPSIDDGASDFGIDATEDPSDDSAYELDNSFSHLEIEKKFVVQKYLPRQVDLSVYMRALLVDWMVEVQQKLYLFEEALYLAVNIMDRFLSIETCSRARLGLLGAAAISIASKYEDKAAPTMEEFLSCCKDAFARDELAAMEAHVFATLNYEIGTPLSYRFLNRYVRVARLPLKTVMLARYVLESSLLDYTLVDQRESKRAAAALLQALRMKALSWSATLQHHSGYKEEELCAVQQRMNKFLLQLAAGDLKSISEKYSHKQYFSVAALPLLPDETN